MTREDLNALKPGSIVTSACGDAYVVILDHGDRKIAVRTVEITNPIEWSIPAARIHPMTCPENAPGNPGGEG